MKLINWIRRVIAPKGLDEMTQIGPKEWIVKCTCHDLQNRIGVHYHIEKEKQNGN